MVKKETCTECEINEAIFKCASCENYLCEDCANDEHACLIEAIDLVKDNLFIDIESIDELEED